MPIPSQDHREPLAVVAESSAHALNNMLATLFAAESYLEDAVEGPHEKARAAILSACGSATALSAALHLLSITPEDAKRLQASNHSTLIDSDSLHSIARWLARNVVMECSFPEPGEHTIVLDYDTLKALLLCAGTDLRRLAGARALIRCTFAAHAHAAESRPRLSFSFATDIPAGSRSGHGLSRYHCTIALDHAALVLQHLGVTLHPATGGSTGWQIDLRARA